MGAEGGVRAHPDGRGDAAAGRAGDRGDAQGPPAHEAHPHPLRHRLGARRGERDARLPVGRGGLPAQAGGAVPGEGQGGGLRRALPAAAGDRTPGRAAPRERHPRAGVRAAPARGRAVALSGRGQQPAAGVAGRGRDAEGPGGDHRAADRRRLRGLRRRARAAPAGGPLRRARRGGAARGLAPGGPRRRAGGAGVPRRHQRARRGQAPDHHSAERAGARPGRDGAGAPEALTSLQRGGRGGGRGARAAGGDRHRQRAAVRRGARGGAASRRVPLHRRARAAHAADHPAARAAEPRARAGGAGER